MRAFLKQNTTLQHYISKFFWQLSTWYMAQNILHEGAKISITFEMTGSSELPLKFNNFFNVLILSASICIEVDKQQQNIVTNNLTCVDFMNGIKFIVEKMFLLCLSVVHYYNALSLKITIIYCYIISLASYNLTTYG